VAANIYIFCSSGVDDLTRRDLEKELKAFLRGAVENREAGGGNAGCNLHYEVASGHYSVTCDRVKAFLADRCVRPGMVLELFPDGWQPGMPWRRVEIFGADRWVTEREVMPRLADEVNLLKDSQARPFHAQTLRAALNVLAFLDDALFGASVWALPRDYCYDISGLGYEQLGKLTWESEEEAARDFATDVASGFLDELCDALDLQRAGRIRSELGL
jgi:hypothetical protein